MSKKITYKDAGVDIAEGEKLVDAIRKQTESTHTSGVISEIGGFGGFFKPDFGAYRDPVLISSVDGVGTKLKVAFRMSIHDTVGQDLVNHCVNDIAVCGADPLFFLDYFSTGKLEHHVGYEVIKGFARACRENGCALIGGETAEMPDLYQPGEFDLAGTIVGMVDREMIVDGSRVREGDVLLGFQSTGLHTNGYSLARKVLFEHYDVHDHIEGQQESVGQMLLRVHRSYLPIIRRWRDEADVHAFAHITGGGIPGNVKRIIPDGLEAEIDWDRWDYPALFKTIQEKGGVPEEDMRATFNLGIGLVMAVDPDKADEVIRRSGEDGETVYKIGKVKKDG